MLRIQHQQFMQRLLQLPLFEKLAASQLTVLLGIAQVRRLPDGTCLWRREQQLEAMWVLLQGQVVRVARSSSPTTVSAVSLLGETALLGRIPPPYGVVAKGEILLLEFRARELEKVFTAHTDIAQRICRNAVVGLAQRLQDANDRVVEIARERAELDECIRERETHLNALDVIRSMRG